MLTLTRKVVSPTNFSIMILAITLLCFVGISPVVFAEDAEQDEIESVRGSLSGVPMYFTENKGQWDDLVLYKGDGKGGLTWWFERDGLTIAVTVPDTTAEPITDHSMGKHSSPPRYPIKGHALKMRFVSSKKKDTEIASISDDFMSAIVQPSEVIPSDPLSWNNNYFYGNDPDKWAPDCRNYTKLTYNEVWDGVDVIYFGDGKQLKYDIIVRPGADPTEVQLRWLGLEEPLSVDDDGMLLLATSVGTLREAIPIAYQRADDGSRETVEVRFMVLSDSEIGFDVGDYDPTRALVIDPVAYSTYLGGNRPDDIYAVTTDGNGGVIVVGTASSPNFPVTQGAFDERRPNRYPARVAFVTRINSNGSELIYSTYLDGTRGSFTTDFWAVCSGTNGSAIISGRTSYVDFPITRNAFQREYNGHYSNVFVTCLNSRGNGIIYSTYLGAYGNNWGRDIITQNNQPIVTGMTSSPEFPVTEGAFDEEFNGEYYDQDVIVSKFNQDASDLIYSTYLGGNDREQGYGIANIGDGGVVVTGYTQSEDFPTTQNAYDNEHNGSNDVFVTRLNAAGSDLIFSTLVGGNENETAYDIAVDSVGKSPDYIGFIAITGATLSNDYPTTEDAFDTEINGGIDGFVTLLTTDGSSLIYSTFLGGSGHDYSRGIVTDRGEVIVTGYTESDDFPTTDGAFDREYNGGESDAFITRFNSDGSDLIYSSYLGGNDMERACKIIMDEDGVNLVVVGITRSGDFPTTQGALMPNQPEFVGNNPINGFISKLDGQMRVIERLAWINYPAVVYAYEFDLIHFTVEGASIDQEAQLIITYHSNNIPNNAEVTFEDHGNGTADFTWQTYAGDAGDYAAIFRLSDGNNQVSTSVRIIVLPTQIMWVEIPDSVNVFAEDVCTFILEGNSRNDDDILTITADQQSMPRGAELIDLGDGLAEFSWLPVWYQVGSYLVSFRLSNGVRTIPGSVHITVHEADIVGDEPIIPSEFALFEPHPNPFNNQTLIRFDVPVASEVSLGIYDISGRLLDLLIEGNLAAGSHSVVWEASNFAAGVYLVRMHAGNYEGIRKAVLVK